MNSKIISLLLAITVSIIYQVNCVDPVPVWKGKRYELEKSEKFDELLTELGMAFPIDHTSYLNFMFQG